MQADVDMLNHPPKHSNRSCVAHMLGELGQKGPHWCSHRSRVQSAQNHALRRHQCGDWHYHSDIEEGHLLCPGVLPAGHVLHLTMYTTSCTEYFLKCHTVHGIIHNLASSRADPSQAGDSGQRIDDHSTCCSQWLQPQGMHGSFSMCAVLQHVMHRFPEAAAWPSSMQTRH